MIYPAIFGACASGNVETVSEEMGSGDDGKPLGSLSDLGIAGCKSTAAVHFSLRPSLRTPHLLTHDGAMGLQIPPSLSPLGPISAFGDPSPTGS